MRATPAPTFLLGIVQLAEGHAEAAATRFKQILDRKQRPSTRSSRSPRCNYGRALVKMGKVDEGRQAYEQFFENWKKADTNLPLLVDAKKEYERFKTTNQTTMQVTKPSDQSPR